MTSHMKTFHTHSTALWNLTVKNLETFHNYQASNDGIGSCYCWDNIASHCCKFTVQKSLSAVHIINMMTTTYLHRYWKLKIFNLQRYSVWRKLTIILDESRERNAEQVMPRCLLDTLQTAFKIYNSKQILRKYSHLMSNFDLRGMANANARRLAALVTKFIDGSSSCQTSNVKPVAHAKMSHG